MIKNYVGKDLTTYEAELEGKNSFNSIITEGCLGDEKRTFSAQKNPYIFISTIFAFIFAALPFLTFIFACVYYKLTFEMLFVLWGVFYCVLLIAVTPIYLINKKTLAKSEYSKFNVRSKTNNYKLLHIFALIILVSITLSTILNIRTISLLNVFSIFTLFLVFICVAKIESRKINSFILLLITSVAFSALLGLIDPVGAFIPGFSSSNANLSLFFANPNYAGYIMSMFIVLDVNLIIREKKGWRRLSYCAFYAIMAFYLYLNASFVPITAVYIVLISEMIALWVKKRKFPLQLFLLIISFVIFAFLIMLYPNYLNYSTTTAPNFFVEAVAVFDNIFGTNLLHDWLHIDLILGADGWDRTALLTNALKQVLGSNEIGIISKIRTVFIGGGTGSLFYFRPHNLLLGLWIEYGIFVPIAFIGLVAYIIHYSMKKLIASKDNKGSILNGLFFAAICYLLCTIFGSLIVVHFCYFVIILALMIKQLDFNIINND